jgi:hypothetical protein
MDDEGVEGVGMGVWMSGVGRIRKPVGWLRWNVLRVPLMVTRLAIGRALNTFKSHSHSNTHTHTLGVGDTNTERRPLPGEPASPFGEYTFYAPAPKPDRELEDEDDSLLSSRRHLLPLYPLDHNNNLQTPFSKPKHLTLHQ